jgi:phosphoserine phosphatase
MGDLTSWVDGPGRWAIVDFVERVVEDGPGLQTQQPYQAAHEQDLHWLGAAMVKHYRGDDSDLNLLMAAVTRAFGDVPVEGYDARVQAFFATAEHPTLGRPYRSCGYAPMVELLDYLAANGFTTYIASGGDRDFMRPVADDLYGVPPERVIGSALGLTYQEADGHGQLLYKTAMDFFDDGPEKPVRIWSRIGRRPILSVGNSNGDRPMLAFCGRPSGPALRLLLLHDDADREFDYVAGAEDALAVAATSDWTVISMKRDWSRVFATPGDGAG